MTNIKLIDPIQYPMWDKFVENHPFGRLCHLSGWKQVIEKSFKHMKGYYFCIFDDTEQSIEAALPIYTIKSWLTGDRLVSIPYATLSDPLVSTNEQFNALFESALKPFNTGKNSYMEIRTLKSHKIIQNYNRLAQANSYKHHYVTLEDSPMELRRKFHRSCVRQRISRAMKSDIVIKVGRGEPDLKRYYQLHLKTRKRTGRPVQPYRFFKCLWDNFQPSDQLTLLLAEKDNHTIAGLILFKFKHRVSAEFAASDEAFGNISPSHYLFWEAIKLAYDESYKIFDFGRTSSLNKSLMDFKGRWATKVIDLIQFYYPKDIVSGMGQKEETKRYQVMSKICKKSPDFTLKLIGNFCYRHLG